MLGLVILFIFGVYLAISVFVTRYVMAWARESGRRPWLWGCIGGFAMYSLVFWDLIPTLIMHKYYCSTEAGFWPYKTFEQWELENPGVAATFNSRIKPSEAEQMVIPIPEGTDRFWYNVRFYRDKRRIEKLGTIVEIEQRFVDAEANAVVARSIDFARGLPPSTLALGGTPAEIRKSLVLGSGNRQCGIDGMYIDDIFTKFIYDYWKSGRRK